MKKSETSDKEKVLAFLESKIDKSTPVDYTPRKINDTFDCRCD